jgi:hypothetical protein
VVRLREPFEDRHQLLDRDQVCGFEIVPVERVRVPEPVVLGLPNQLPDLRFSHASIPSAPAIVPTSESVIRGWGC